MGRERGSLHCHQGLPGRSMQMKTRTRKIKYSTHAFCARVVGNDSWRIQRAYGIYLRQERGRPLGGHLCSHAPFRSRLFAHGDIF